MTPKDYKNTARSPSKARERRGSWMSFVSGLALGLLVALAVYLWSGSLPPPASLISKRDSSSIDQGKFDEPDVTSDTKVVLPRPKFDFYTILPEMEVPVPEWELSDKDDEDEPSLAPGIYVLQVGSFKQFDDADHAKARLALRGITARIHRVVINGQDVWFRVHVGPFSGIKDIRAMRIKLIENDMDFILLRIGAEDAT
ncbi:MAG: SPOR domain-containing protein [Pseudomonadota bacterium]|nr:SPOR domain-containing protein [Pseudomonadota bacterium]